MTSCAATTTIREALEETRDFLQSLFREPADEPTHVAARVALALDALALLEQLVEAAQALRELTSKYDGPQLRHWLGSQDVAGSVDSERAASIVHEAIRVAAAVAAVGPGQKEKT